MVKTIISVIISCVLLIAGYLYIFNTNQSVENKPADGVSPTNLSTFPSIPDTSPGPTIPTNLTTNDNYQLNYIIVRPSDSIGLFSNLTEKLTSTEAVKKYGCTYLISGGFYDTEDNHLGLLISEGLMISESISSSLFNGYFIIDNNKLAKITGKKPTNLEGIRIGLQSGPLLYTSRSPINLNSSSEDKARRIIAAINNRNEILFLSLNNPNNPINGPTLKELPNLIKEINNSSSLNIVNAINLDGGSHSVFISNRVNISELSTAGSFFCIKPN